MDELEWIALACVIVGLPLLFGLSFFVEAGDYARLETHVTGKITKIYDGEPMRLWVEETRLVPILVFDHVYVEEGAVVDIEGRTTDDAFIAEQIRRHHPE